MTRSETLAELYVLGALDDTQSNAVRERIEHPDTEDDHVLATAVAAFGEAFHEIDATVTPLTPSESAKARLDAALDAVVSDDDEPHAGRADNVTTLPPAQKRAAPWRPVALVAIAASVVLAVGLVWQAMIAQKPLVMAILMDDAGRSVAVIEAFSDDSFRVTPLAAFSPEDAQVLQVWTKPDPDGPPVSLGILDKAMRVQVDGPELPMPSADQLYEITVEPEGGSPTGLPTGPIVGKGLAQPTY